MDKEGFTQRNSKKYKNRATKRSPGYGKPVPPSKHLELDDNKVISGENAGKMRFTVYENGVKCHGKLLVVKDSTWEEFLGEAADKVRLKAQARRVFSVSGEELFSMHELRSGEELFVSSGKDFIQTTRPGDALFERPLIPDFKFRWVTTNKGRLSLTHQPRVNHLKWLPDNGCTHLVTVLGKSEGSKIKKGLGKCGKDMNWTWIPLKNASPDSLPGDMSFNASFNEISRSLEQGGGVVIHCSDGVHRSGMVALALLKFLEFDEMAQHEMMESLQPGIMGKLGEKRTAWATALVSGMTNELSRTCHASSDGTEVV